MLYEQRVYQIRANEQVRYIEFLRKFTAAMEV